MDNRYWQDAYEALKDYARKAGVKRINEFREGDDWEPSYWPGFELISVPVYEDDYQLTSNIFSHELGHHMQNKDNFDRKLMGFLLEKGLHRSIFDRSFTQIDPYEFLSEYAIPMELNAWDRAKRVNRELGIPTKGMEEWIRKTPDEYRRDDDPARRFPIGRNDTPWERRVLEEIRESLRNRPDPLQILPEMYKRKLANMRLGLKDKFAKSDKYWSDVIEEMKKISPATNIQSIEYPALGEPVWDTGAPPSLFVPGLGRFVPGGKYRPLGRQDHPSIIYQISPNKADMASVLSQTPPWDMEKRRRIQPVELPLERGLFGW